MLIPAYVKAICMHGDGNGLRISIQAGIKKCEAGELVKKKAAYLSKGEWFEGNSWNALLWEIQE